jgi:hypothetical protein
MSEERQVQWVSQGDIKGRMRLLRYGLVVAVITIFLITWLVPYIFLSAYTGELIKAAEEAHATNPDVPIPQQFGVGDSLGWGVVAAIVSIIISVVVYFAYGEILKRTVGGGAGIG